MILTGCCGWAGSRARYFADFAAVELQSTFYQPPSAELAARWRSAAPADFVFTMKAWQLITHAPSSPTYRKLQTAIDRARAEHYGGFQWTSEVEQAWHATRSIAQALRAEVVVFQCPASFEPTAKNQRNLERFFREIGPCPWVNAWEPRGKWEPALVAELCEKLDLVHCVDPFAAEMAHGRMAYFRLHGRGGVFYRYTDEELRALAEMCARECARGRSPVYVMFNNAYLREDAARFQKMSGGRGTGITV